MVRKSHKGIIGTARVTLKNRPHIGPGIGFKEMNLTTGDEIARAAEAADKKFEE